MRSAGKRTPRMFSCPGSKAAVNFWYSGSAKAKSCWYIAFKKSLLFLLLLLLQIKQLLLYGQPSRVAGQASVRAYHAVARNDNHNRIVMICHPHRAGRFWIAYLFRNLSIGSGLSIRNLTEGCPYLLLKGRSLRSKRQVKLSPPSRKIFPKLCRCLLYTSRCV